VYRDYGGYRPSVSSEHSAMLIHAATGGEIRSERCGIQVTGALVHVYKLRPRPCLRDGFGCGNECVRDGNDRVARLDSGGDQRKSQRIRAAANPYAIARAAVLRKLMLELFYDRPAHECRLRECRLEYPAQFGLQRLMWRD
jgi:hypothetical protein